ncbi:hypothetical protein ES705_50457 [subsurface metagenome]
MKRIHYTAKPPLNTEVADKGGRGLHNPSLYRDLWSWHIKHSDEFFQRIDPVYHIRNNQGICPLIDNDFSPLGNFCPQKTFNIYSSCVGEVKHFNLDGTR